MEKTVQIPGARRGIGAATANQVAHTSVLSWKLVEEKKMSKSSSGKAQAAAIAIAIARICNAAWRRFSASL